jgi:O-glycosyl hydrolase
VSNGGDTQAPTVSLTAPASGATVSGTVSVTATASDNVAVVGVQFKLDGNNLSSEDVSSPYSISWSTTGTPNGSHQLTATARDAAGNVTTSSVRTVTVSNGGGGGTALTLNGNTRYQTIDGFGISANSLSWNNGELRPAIDRLHDEGGSTIWRVVIDMADWEATNDDSNPNNFNWAYYDTIYSSAKFEELWATMAYLNQKGVTNLLMLNFMGRGPSWLGGADLPTALEDEWVETVASAAYYARNNRHLQFGLFAPNNESDWDGIEGIRMDRWQHARVMAKLAAKLDAIGLGDLRLIGPDTAAIGAGVNDYLPSLMDEPTVMAKLDHFTFHNYAGDSGGADSAIRNSAYPSKNFWISEVSNIWDALTHLSQGPAAILVWDGYDSVYNHAILAGRGSSPPNDAGNGPALLSYSTSTRLYTPRKAFYEFTQLFKFVPAGSVRIAATESSSNVTVYAFHHVASGRVTLVGRNAGSSNVTFSGTLTNLPTVPAFEFYRTTSSTNMERTSDVTVTGQTFSFSAPANGVFTLTYAGPADTVPPTVSVTAPQGGATVSGNVSVSSSTASDNVGIRGVQFKLDGALLGVEDVTAPYSVSWNTTGAANGAHSLTAVARDWAGNVTTSTAVQVTVAN